MTLFESIGLFQAQVSNMDSLWAYYSTATFAVLGFTIASEKATRSRNEILVIQLGYILFAIGNAAAIAAAQSALVILGEMVKSAGGTAGIAIAFPVWQVMLFHTVVSVSVLVLIEAAYRYNKTLHQV